MICHTASKTRNDVVHGGRGVQLGAVHLGGGSVKIESRQAPEAIVYPRIAIWCKGHAANKPVSQPHDFLTESGLQE